MASETTNRRKAREAGAPDVQDLIRAIPYLKRMLSTGQVAQLQRVIDANFVNPIYEKEFRKAIEASVIGRGGGGMIAYDSRKKQKAYRILKRRVKVSKSDASIRLNHNKMLTANALVPRTNNPDEADYLVWVRNVLGSMGVWLHLRLRLEPWGRTPTVWEFYFTLGHKGDVIETRDSKIDREELLETAMLGAGYYRSVLTGRVQTKLKHADERIYRYMQRIWSKHQELDRNRQKQPIVALAAKAIGGGKLPSQSIWVAPRKYRAIYSDALIAGDVVRAKIYMLITVCLIEQNARLLADYLSKTIDGAEQALKVLEWIEKIAETFELVSCLAGVGMGIKFIKSAGKNQAKRAGRRAARRAARRRSQEDRMNDLWAEIELKKAQRSRTTPMTDAELAEVSSHLQPSSTTLGGRKAKHSSGGGRGFHSYP